jgi:hypothetical protein
MLRCKKFTVTAVDRVVTSALIAPSEEKVGEKDLVMVEAVARATAKVFLEVAEENIMGENLAVVEEEATKVEKAKILILTLLVIVICVKSQAIFLLIARMQRNLLKCYLNVETIILGITRQKDERIMVGTVILMNSV